MKKAKLPYQLVLIDENGKQMLSKETTEPFSIEELQEFNRAIVVRQLDSIEDGHWYYF